MSGCGRHLFGSDPDCPSFEALRLGRIQGRAQAQAWADEQDRITAEHERAVAREQRRSARRERRAQGSADVPLVSGVGPGWRVGVPVFLALGFAAGSAALAALVAVVAVAIVASKWGKGLGPAGRAAAVVVPAVVLIMLTDHPAGDTAVMVASTWAAVRLSTRPAADLADQRSAGPGRIESSRVGQVPARRGREGGASWRGWITPPHRAVM